MYTDIPECPPPLENSTKPLLKLSNPTHGGITVGWQGQSAPVKLPSRKINPTHTGPPRKMKGSEKGKKKREGKQRRERRERKENEGKKKEE